MLQPIPDWDYNGLLSAYVPRPTAVSLIRYAQILGIDERQFFGVEDPPTEAQEFYWTGSERRQLAEALLAAERLIEAELGVPLSPKWAVGEQHDYQYPLLLDWGEFICAGRIASSIYSNGPIAVDYSTPDIGVVTVSHGEVGSESEVVCFYYDSDAPTKLYRVLYPSDVDWSADDITITFPKWRLVKPELMDTGRALDIDDDTNFVEKILVARVYTDITDQATFVGESLTQTGYIQCDLNSISKVRVEPGSYSSGVWTKCLPGFVVRYVTVNYKAGLRWLPYELEQAVVRLAHALLPEPVCPVGHEPWVRFWSRDRERTQPTSRERVNAPWGLEDGAWFAWNVVQRSPYNLNRGGKI